MRYLAFGLTLETAINFDGVLQPSTASPDLFITEGVVPEKAGQLTRLQRRGIRARFGRAETGIILQWEGVGTFNMLGGDRIIYQNLGADESTLRLFLLSEVIGISLYQRGLFLLHASAVMVNNEAFVFMGVPGAGKSTTATAFGKAGHTVLSDDLVAIQFLASKPHVVPAFSQYKVWKNALDGLRIDSFSLTPSFEGADKFLITQPVDTFPQECVPVRQVTVLYSPAARIRQGPIKPLRAPVELLRHFPLPVQLLASGYLQQHFQQSLQIAQSTPIQRLKRPGDFMALEDFVRSKSSL